MIILAVDYGESRTGIAVCDKNEMLATPVSVITQTDAGVLAKEIAAVAAERKAELVVVGLPKNMDGTEGERAIKSRELARLITKKSEIETVMWDERLTTVSAHYVLNDTNTRGKKRKAVVDAVAASLILQSYIDYRRNTNAEK